jgi:hypothetical protein
MTHLFTSLSFLHGNILVIPFSTWSFCLISNLLDSYQSTGEVEGVRSKISWEIPARFLDRWTPFVSVPRWYDAVALRCHLFSRVHDHIVETSRADHYRAPCSNRRIAPLVPTPVGWDDRWVPLRYKRGNPSAVLQLPSLACFRARQGRRSCFPLASFGQPATSPSPLLLRPLIEQAVSPSSSTTSRRSSEEDRGKNLGLHRRPYLNSWRRSSPSIGRLQRCTSASSAEFVFC